MCLLNAIIWFSMCCQKCSPGRDIDCPDWDKHIPSSHKCSPSRDRTGIVSGEKLKRHLVLSLVMSQAGLCSCQPSNFSKSCK